MTEFGAVGDEPGDVDLLHWQTAAADEALQGWAYWTYKSFDDVTTQNAHTETLFNADGSLQEAKARALARTYARAVAGRPLAMSFDPHSAVFALRFIPAPAAAACGAAGGAAAAYATEVFVHLDYYYPEGHEVAITGADGADLVAAGQASVATLEQGNSPAGRWAVLSVEVTGPALEGTEVTVGVAPSVALP